MLCVLCPARACWSENKTNKGGFPELMLCVLCLTRACWSENKTNKGGDLRSQHSVFCAQLELVGQKIRPTRAEVREFAESILCMFCPTRACWSENKTKKGGE